jgi:hypothetical protein
VLDENFEVKSVIDFGLGHSFILLGVDTGGKSDLKVLGPFFYFPRYRPPFGECCV